MPEFEFKEESWSTTDKIIIAAQQSTRVQKARFKNIHCPFFKLNTEQIDICTICHMWMKTDRTTQKPHPCNWLSPEEIRKRFWRKIVGGKVNG